MERGRTASRTETYVKAAGEELGLSLASAEAISKVVTAGLQIKFSESTTDTDSTTGGVSTVVKEIVRVPTGGLDLVVRPMN